MKRFARINRRNLLQGALAVAGGLTLSGCARLSDSEDVNAALASAQSLTQGVQRLMMGRDTLAREYPPSAISKDFRANGTTDPGTPEYERLARDHFADWRLRVGGLVERPMQLSLADLRSMPAQTQITRHDCVEGWSCIGMWTGTRLSHLLARTGLKKSARYIAFFCADSLELTLDGTGQYYETIDLVDAMHPQTILAYGMNGQPLPIPHGAPLRLRLERQLGYKMAKYIMRIDAVDSFQSLGRGKGGYWEDRGYQWYAGI